MDVRAGSGSATIGLLIYRGDWSTPEVEHLLAVDTYGNPTLYLTGDAGLRNNEAEAFAAQCQQRYADKNLLQSMSDAGYVRLPWFCPIHFPIGDLLGWSIRGSIDTQDYSAEELARAVVEPIRSRLIPCVGEVTTLGRLLDFLQGDEAPLRWIMSRAHYRAALIAYLARKVGIENARTKSTLLSHATAIMRGIDATWLTSETYIDRILEDADPVLATIRG
jgi:hypothetical protein